MGQNLQDFVAARSLAGPVDYNNDALYIVQSGSGFRIPPGDVIKLKVSRTITDSDSLEVGDAFSVLDVNIGTAKNLTVTAQAAGSVFYILRRGVGELTFVESGVTITPQLGALTDGGEDTIVTLIFTTTTTALLQNGAPISISSSDIIGALGYTPANATSEWSAPIVKSGDQVVATTSWADITDLTFAITAGKNVAIRGVFYIDSGNSTEGYAISINGPTLVRTYHVFDGAVSTTSTLKRPGTAYDGTSVLTTVNVSGGCEFNGMVEVSANGTIAMRIRGETGGFDVTVKAGSWIQYKVIS